MARGINKVIIVGNLGQDPETRTFPDGGSITNISIATSESWTDKQTGQKQERTEWHRVVFHRRLAEIAAQYLRKGSKVYIEGSLRTSKYQDKQTGADRYSTEIVAREMQMLDSRSDAGAPAAAYQQPAAQTYQAPAAQAAPAYQQPAQAAPAPAPVYQQPAPVPAGAAVAPQAAPAAPAPQAAPGGFDDFDDDIPF